MDMEKAAFSDVDGTLGQPPAGFYIKQLCDLLYKEGYFSEKEYERSNEIVQEYKKGSREYTEAAQEAVRVFASGIKGRKRADAERIGEKYIQTHPKDIFSFTEGLISVLRHKGYRPVLLSGSPEEIIIPFGWLFRIGKGDVFATEFGADNKGRYTGEILRSMVEPGAKKSAVEAYAAMHGIDLSRSAAFGDTENDMQMFELVGYPFAVKPNEVLRKIASERAWPMCSQDDLMINSASFYFR